MFLRYYFKSKAGKCMPSPNYNPLVINNLFQATPYIYSKPLELALILISIPKLYYGINKGKELKYLYE